MAEGEGSDGLTAAAASTPTSASGAGGAEGIGHEGGHEGGSRGTESGRTSGEEEKADHLNGFRMSNGPELGSLGDAIRELKERKKALFEEQKNLKAALKKTEKRRARIVKSTRKLSDEDIRQLLAERKRDRRK